MRLACVTMRDMSEAQALQIQQAEVTPVTEFPRAVVIKLQATDGRVFEFSTSPQGAHALSNRLIMAAAHAAQK